MAKEKVTAPGADPGEPLNNELMDIAEQLGGGDSSLLPASKQEISAEQAAADAKKAAIEQGAVVINKGLTGLAALACARIPQLEPVWTPEVIDRIARAAAAVFLKYGVESGPFMAKYAEEIELLMAAGEPLVLSYFIIKKAKEQYIQQTGGLPTAADNNTIEPAAGDTASSAPTMLK